MSDPHDGLDDAFDEFLEQMTWHIRLTKPRRWCCAILREFVTFLRTRSVRICEGCKSTTAIWRMDADVPLCERCYEQYCSNERVEQMADALLWVVNLAQGVGKAGGTPETGEWETAIEAASHALSSMKDADA